MWREYVHTICVIVAFACLMWCTSGWHPGM